MSLPGCEAAHVTRDRREVGLSGAVGGGEPVSYIPGHQWEEFTSFFRENYGRPGKMSYDFFSFSKQIFFFKGLFHMIHLLKPGSCLVEYSFSTRGLFLPTVSWTPAVLGSLPLWLTITVDELLAPCAFRFRQNAITPRHVLP